MFDSAALDHSLSKADFEKLAMQLRVDLLAAQSELAELRVRARKAFERAVPLTREEVSRDGESEEPRSIS